MLDLFIGGEGEGGAGGGLHYTQEGERSKKKKKRKMRRTFRETADVSHWLDQVRFLLWLPPALWACITTSGNLCLPMADACMRANHPRR